MFLDSFDNILFVFLQLSIMHRFQNTTTICKCYFEKNEECFEYEWEVTFLGGVWIVNSVEQKNLDDLHLIEDFDVTKPLFGRKVKSKFFHWSWSVMLKDWNNPDFTNVVSWSLFFKPMN